MPIIDVNNIFNSTEDKVQYALGTMNAYSIIVDIITEQQINYNYIAHAHAHVHVHTSGAATITGTFVRETDYSGIIAVTPAEALIKFLIHYPKEVQNHSLRVVSLCE